MRLKLRLYEQFILIHSTHLPSITIGVDVTIEPLEEDKKLLEDVYYLQLSKDMEFQIVYIPKMVMNLIAIPIFTSIFRKYFIFTCIRIMSHIVNVVE